MRSHFGSGHNWSIFSDLLAALCIIAENAVSYLILGMTTNKHFFQKTTLTDTQGYKGQNLDLIFY